MDNYLESNCTRYVVFQKGEFFGIACLAIIGAISIIGNIANRAYKLGRDTKEVEMKREFKQYLKKQKREGA